MAPAAAGVAHRAKNGFGGGEASKRRRRDPRYLPDHVERSHYRYQPGLFARTAQFVIGVAQCLLRWKILSIEDRNIGLYTNKLRGAAEARNKSPDQSRR
jgi:hypothetical protein